MKPPTWPSTRSGWSHVSVSHRECHPCTQANLGYPVLQVWKKHDKKPWEEGWSHFKHSAPWTFWRRSYFNTWWLELKIITNVICGCFKRMHKTTKIIYLANLFDRKHWEMMKCNYLVDCKNIFGRKARRSENDLVLHLRTTAPMNTHRHIWGSP